MVSTDLDACPCGLGSDYRRCCGRYLRGKAIPKTPEALMRSRYTAYAKADVHYIQKTMRDKPLVGFNPSTVQKWAASVQWLGLEVIAVEKIGDDPPLGSVEFIANYLENGIKKNIHERSTFVQRNGRWFYINGEACN